MRSSQEVQAEIAQSCGFFPPFFSPAVETPEILESLWQQSLASYVNNPLPALFKESLFAHLSQYCSVPYCLVCHSCALRPLGVGAEEILKLLETPIAKEEGGLLLLSSMKDALKEWPEPNSELWTALFASSVRIFRRPARAYRHREELRRLLGGPSYVHLTALLAYINTSHNWMEANPEVSYEADRRVQENLSTLLQESPRLEEFFQTYSDRIGREREGSARRRALQRETGKFQILAKTTREGVILANQDGNITFCNQAGEEMFGYPVVELMGRPITLLIPQIFHDALDQTMELVGRKKSGEEFPVEFSLSSWRQEGRNDFVGILRDLSERKRIVEADRQSKEILREKVEELRRNRDEVALLSEMARVLQAVVSADEAYATLGRLGPKCFPEISGAFYIMNESKVLLEKVAHWGDGFVGGATFDPSDCWALRTGRAHAVENFRSDLVCQHLGEDWKARALCLPLVAQGETLGVLNLQSGEGFSEAQQLLAAAFVEPVALGLANLRLRGALRAQAIRDPLTELFNRRYMEEFLVRELAIAERRSTSLGILMVDIDHFKAFNDARGHAAGDRLLRALGSSIQKRMRREDIACRYGGEEFLLLLVDASAKDSVKLAEGIREVAKKLRVIFQGQALPPVTISIGVAVYPDHGATTEELVEAADAALYLAKAEGRNRVKVAPEKTKTSTPLPRIRGSKKTVDRKFKARFET